MTAGARFANLVAADVRSGLQLSDIAIRMGNRMDFVGSRLPSPPSLRVLTTCAPRATAKESLCEIEQGALSFGRPLSHSGSRSA